MLCVLAISLHCSPMKGPEKKGGWGRAGNKEALIPFPLKQSWVLPRRRHRVNPSAPLQTPSEWDRLSRGFGAGGGPHL